MRFHAEHQFPGRVESVIGILADPSFHTELEIPDLELVGVVEHDDDGVEATIVLRYEFVGHLDPMVQRLLGGRRLTWLQELVVDRAGRSGRLRFALETNRERLRGDATFTFLEHDGGTVRRLDGDVTVSVPFVGAKAERRIVDGFLRRLDLEAGFLTDRLNA